MERAHVQAASRAETKTRERCLIAELWNGPQDEALSIARARVPAGTTTELHALDGVDERYAVLGGRGAVEVDGERYAVGPGDVVGIPAGAAQRASADAGVDLIFLCLCTPRFQPTCYRPLDG